MGVFSRLSDIVNSNINSLLDRAEDPEKIMRLIIQEMEDTLVEVRASAARAIADRKELERKRADFQQRHDEWGRKAELAVERGRDDLARGALVAKRKAGEMAEMLSSELRQIDETIGKSTEDLAQLQAKLKEAKAKQRSVEIRRQAASDRVRVNRLVYSNRVEDAVARYDQFERKVDELEAEAEVYAAGRPRSLTEQFAELEAEETVNAELAQLKKQVSDRGGNV
jgi:phage shock protein A